MMKVANLSTDLRSPWEAVDVPTAVTIWQGIWALHHSPDDDARVIRTMMDVANKLVDLRSPGPIRVEPAIAIWRGILALDPCGADGGRAIATMMDLARRLSDQGDPERGLQDAIQLWEAVYRLEASPEGRLGVVKHMMAAANRRSQAGQPEARRDLPGAIVIWRAIADLSVEAEDRLVVALTMMSVARAMLEAGEPWPALLLWSEAFHVSSDDGSRLRTVKTVLGLASSSPVFASEAAGLLREGDSTRLDPDFRDPVLAGLLYYARDYEAVLRLAGGSHHPAVRALGADALRKLGRIDQAIAQADAVLDGTGLAPGLSEHDARVSALCCRGYCRIEQARSGADLLPLAIADFEAAAAQAREARLPPPPRASTGRGYALRALGRQAEAEAAFAEALLLDADNRKALQAGPEEKGGEQGVREPGSKVALPTGPMTLDAFEAAVRGAQRAEQVAALLRNQVGACVSGAAIEPYTRAVMARARQLNERDDDVASAVVLWSACAGILPEAEDHQRILAVMRAVARQRAEGVGRPRDLAGAVHILHAVHRGAREPDQRLAVLKSMMHVANLHSDLSSPWRAVDVAGAVALWQGAWGLHHSAEDDERVIRTMMSVAAMLARPGEPQAERLEAAAAIRRAVAELEGL